MAYQPEAGGPLDKFRLLYTVATDPGGTRATSAVLAVLLWRYNKAHGCCWPSVESIAEDAGLDTRTDQRAIEALERAGYLHVVRDKGRLNRYVPHFQACREPGSNGTAAGGRGRQMDPQGTSSRSRRGGIHDVTPTAPMPPEYLNEPIPEKGKEKSSLPSEGKRDTHLTAKRSPAEQAKISKAIADTRLTLQMVGPTAYEARLREIEASYRDACAVDGQEVDEEVIKLLRERGAE